MLVTLDRQVTGTMEGMIHLKRTGPHLGMTSNLGMRRPLPASGTYLLVGGERKMQKGTNDVGVIKLKKMLQFIRWIPYLEALT